MPGCRREHIAWLGVLAFAVVVACGKAPAPTAAPPEGTVALVGGVPIAQSALDDQVQRLPASLRDQYQSPESRRPLLDAMIRNELLVREAERRGYDKDPEYQRMIKQQLIDRLLVKSLEGKGDPQQVSESEIEGYYRAHQSEFVRVDQVRVAHIVVKDRVQAARILKAARALGKANAAGFAALASKHSVDIATRNQGGDLGYIDRNTSPISPVLMAGAHSLQGVGDVSGVLETEHGFHVLRLTERRSSAPRPLAEVKDQIRQRLFQQWRNQQTQRLLEASRARFKVEVYETKIKGGAADDPSLAARQ
jgi:parvulin-like peptidyl-prolyl isomerase